MKKLFLIGFALLLVGCSSNPSNSSYEYEDEEVEDRYIGNPYSSGSGHYAGYEWAERKGGSSCGGNSQSFVEGCEEYLRQTR